jgi:uncharacterized protein
LTTVRGETEHTGPAPQSGGPRTEDFHFTADGQRLAATRTIPPDGGEPDVLALHGLGATSSRHRVRYLLDPLTELGHGAVTFDFSGNGDSTGELERSTLRGRREEALGASVWLDKSAAPVLLGTSMGAHLAACVVPQVRPRALVLFCPAAYPADAVDQCFDGGLARPGPYPDSPAFAGMREFDGDLLIFAARHDEVVPREVVAAYVAAASRARSTEVVWLDCDHFVHRWLPDQAALRTATVRTIADVLRAGSRNR